MMYSVIFETAGKNGVRKVRRSTTVWSRIRDLIPTNQDVTLSVPFYGGRRRVSYFGLGGTMPSRQFLDDIERERGNGEVRLVWLDQGGESSITIVHER